MIRPNNLTNYVYPLGVQFYPETLAPRAIDEPNQRLPNDTLILTPDQHQRILEVRQKRIDMRLAAADAWEE